MKLFAVWFDNNMKFAIRFFSVTVLIASIASAQTIQPTDANALVQKIQSELGGKPLLDSVENPQVPHGEFLHFSINDSPIYPGTENNFQLYVPAQYDPAKPACLLVKLDGMGNKEATVLDNLIAKKEIPIMIGLGITPGAVFKESIGKPKRPVARFNRSFEFDSTNDRFPDFVLNEVLPAAQKLATKDGRPIHISSDGNDHAATGGSTGGIGSFTLAWRRPDQFTRVYSVIGTFVSMRGGNEYPVLIRKTDPKPIRIFLEDGSTDAWNPLFGSWFDANQNMESALTFSGYDVAHAWGTHGHNGGPGAVIFPDVMRWLWRDYPAPIKPGISHNSTLVEVTLPNEGWLTVKNENKITAPDSLAKGKAFHTVLTTHDGTRYASEPGAHTDMPSKIWQIKPNGEMKVVDEGLSSASGICFSPDGGLFFAAESRTKWIYSFVVQPDGTLIDKQPFCWLHTTDIEGNSGAEAMAVDTHGNLYVATRMGVQICDQNGRVRAILPLPFPCGPLKSLYFGDEKFDVLFVSDGKQIYRRRMKLPGLAPGAMPTTYPSQGGG